MANQPSTPQSLQVTGTGVSGRVDLTYESSPNNSAVSKILKIEVNGSIIDPSSTQATSILNSPQTKSQLNSALSSTNRGTSVTTVSLAPSATQVYNNSKNQTGTLSTASASPAASKKTDKFPFSSSTILKYPKDILDDQSDFFSITAFQYVPPNKDSLSLGSKKSGISVLKEGLYSYYANITQEQIKKQDIKGKVILPMPSGAVDVNGVNWGDTYLNPITATAVGSISDFGNYLNPFSTLNGNPSQGPLTTAGSQISDLFSSATNPDTGAFAAAFAASRILGSVGLSIDENELLARTTATGSITNPNAELLFKGPKLRSFSFTYKLTPRNRDEAKEIRQIVRFFKQSMSPQQSTFLLKTPYIFFLEYLRQVKIENTGSSTSGKTIKALNKFKPCALTEFKIDNSVGNMWNSYYDKEDESQPLATTIQFSFTELNPIFFENYEEFSNNDDVGY